ncbi:probable G-protein coupled receptor 139 [Heterodontus francisci]|uniref:probable G-protein coupled receptor 139 n=1 Tax=Heterodontus francisci TaxID=7792 RepID=UPI00355B1898
MSKCMVKLHCQIGLRQLLSDQRYSKANLVAIVILSRGNCGLSKCITVYMVSMAIADLLVMIIHVIVRQIFSFHFPYSLLSYTAVCKFIGHMENITLHTSVWLTVSFTFDRFIAICCGKFKTKYCTVRTGAMVIIAVTVFFCLENIPFYFAYEPVRIINNVSWGCRSRVDFFISTAGIAFSCLQSILVPWLPLALILLLNCLTARRILATSGVRRRLRSHKGGNQSDPEMENRRKSIILLFTISGSFILLWLTVAVSYLLTRSKRYNGDYSAPRYIATESGHALMYLSSCINTCIYAVTQTKFRKELMELLKSPWTFIMTLVKKNVKYNQRFETRIRNMS